MERSNEHVFKGMQVEGEGQTGLAAAPVIDRWLLLLVDGGGVELSLIDGDVHGAGEGFAVSGEIEG